MKIQQRKLYTLKETARSLRAALAGLVLAGVALALPGVLGVFDVSSPFSNADAARLTVYLGSAVCIGICAWWSFRKAGLDMQGRPVSRPPEGIDPVVFASVISGCSCLRSMGTLIPGMVHSGALEARVVQDDSFNLCYSFSRRRSLERSRPEYQRLFFDALTDGNTGGDNFPAARIRESLDREMDNLGAVDAGGRYLLRSSGLAGALAAQVLFALASFPLARGGSNVLAFLICLLPAGLACSAVLGLPGRITRRWVRTVFCLGIYLSVLWAARITTADLALLCFATQTGIALAVGLCVPYNRDKEDLVRACTGFKEHLERNPQEYPDYAMALEIGAGGRGEMESVSGWCRQAFIREMSGKRRRKHTADARS